jgi:hypothetical protein
VAPHIRSTIQASPQLPFNIVTNSGRELAVEAASVVLEGDASVDVETIVYPLGGGEARPLPLAGPRRLAGERSSRWLGSRTPSSRWPSMGAETCSARRRSR